MTRKDIEMTVEQKCAYWAAIGVVKVTGRASPSHFQRMLGWDYERAAAALQLLEDQGVVAPPSGAGGRKILNVPD